MDDDLKEENFSRLFQSSYFALNKLQRRVSRTNSEAKCLSANCNELKSDLAEMLMRTQRHLRAVHETHEDLKRFIWLENKLKLLDSR